MREKIFALNYPESMDFFLTRFPQMPGFHNVGKVACPNRMKRFHEVKLIPVPLHSCMRDATVLPFAVKLGLE